MAGIYTRDGEVLAEQLSSEAALSAAQQEAASRGEVIELYDGGLVQLVHPDGSLAFSVVSPYLDVPAA